MSLTGAFRELSPDSMDQELGETNAETGERYLGHGTSGSSVLPWTPPDLSAFRALEIRSKSSETPSTTATLRARTSTTFAELGEVQTRTSKPSLEFLIDSTNVSGDHIASEDDVRGTGSVHVDGETVRVGIPCSTENALDCRTSEVDRVVVMGRTDLTVLTTSSASSEDVEFELMDAVVYGKNGKGQCIGLLLDPGSAKNILPLSIVISLGWTQEDLAPHGRTKPFVTLSKEGCWPLGKIPMVFETFDEIDNEHKTSFYVVSDDDFDSNDGLLGVKFCREKGILVRQKARNPGTTQQTGHE